MIVCVCFCRKPDSPEESVQDVRLLVLWMTNCLEMLHYFQQNLQADLLLDPAVSLPAGSRKSLLDAQEEVVGVLEETVMYTFQQSVYYLTKVRTNRFIFFLFFLAFGCQTNGIKLSQFYKHSELFCGWVQNK